MDMLAPPRRDRWKGHATGERIRLLGLLQGSDSNSGPLWQGACQAGLSCNHPGPSQQCKGAAAMHPVVALNGPENYDNCKPIRFQEVDTDTSL
jgi:hypothetical protein